MLDYLLLFSFSLLLAGVFGDDVTVSVMTGDDVTLNPNVKHEMQRWKFKDTVITTTEKSTDRLNVDTQTGTLTIQNIRTEDTGEYKLEIKTSTDKILKPFKTFNITLNDQVITVSVMNGESFTLPTGVQTQPVNVKWTFNGTDLTDPMITNIRPEQFGEYKVEINCRDFILHRTLSVKLNDKVESVSVMEGETVTLDTKTPTQADDVIEWKFKNTLIAKVDRRINPQPDPVLDERFRGRLDVDSRGYLIITHIKINESGLYDVHITNSKHIIHKRFSLTVTGGQQSDHMVVIYCAAAVGCLMIVAAVLIFWIYRKHKNKHQQDQTGEDEIIYADPTFNKLKAQRKRVKAEDDVVYAGIVRC